jgi:hypothetical protein
VCVVDGSSCRVDLSALTVTPAALGLGADVETAARADAADFLLS